MSNWKMEEFSFESRAMPSTEEFYAHIMWSGRGIDARDRPMRLDVEMFVEDCVHDDVLGMKQVMRKILFGRKGFDEIIEQVPIRLVGTVTCDHEVPISRWQHFKLACFPQWALKRWPAKTKTVFSQQLAVLDGERPVKIDRYHVWPEWPQDLERRRSFTVIRDTEENAW